MNPITWKRLKSIEAAHGRQTHHQQRLKVYYGWSKINKIQKKEAIAIAFENEELAGSETRRSGKSLRKSMVICYERYQTETEMLDASLYNRVFAVYYVFLEDKQIGGSLNKALLVNAEKDKNHISMEERKKIAEALRSEFLLTHPDYKDPGAQLELDFNTPGKER